MTNRILLTGFLLFIAPLGLFAAETTALAKLAVFPEVLPKLPAVFDGTSPSVPRWDKVPGSQLPGVTLVPASESTVHAPTAAMAYDTGGGETLLIQVIDDADVMAPATRMGQDRYASMSASDGIPVPKKIRVVVAGKTKLLIDGYLTRRDPTAPLLTLIIPDKAGKDRFVVNFSWLSARDDRAEIVAVWLQRVAALVDIDTLHALP